FVSATFPYNLDLCVYGVFMRMRMMLEALSAETDELELLFFVERHQWLQGQALARFQSELNAQWGLHANLTLCVRCSRSQRRSTLARYLAPVIDARKHENYAVFCSDECVAAIENSLKYEPELILVHRMKAMCPLLSIQAALPPVIFDL